MAMTASGGDRRFTTRARAALDSGPQWQSSRVLTGGAAAAVAALAITGVVALGTTGSPAARAQDAAATTAPAKPHYLLPIAALIQDGAVPPPTLSGDNSTIGVPKGTAARPTAPSTTAPNPGGSDITTYRGATGTMTPAGIATLALEHGCSPAQAPTATAVAMAESGGSPSAQGDVSLMTPVWDWSAGLWQIRGLRAERGSGALRDSVANQRATTNAAAMFVISSGCANWSPWTTYTRGSYLGYLGVARQAVTYVLNYRTAHGHYPPVASPDPTAVIPVATGRGPAAPAGTARSSVRPATPSATGTRAASGAPSSPSGRAPSTASGARTSSSGGGGSTTRSAAPSPTPTPSSSSKPVLPLPTVSLPVLSLPVLPPITLPPLSLP